MTKNQHGFTLLEAVISVAIIGIITAVAWPEYERHKLKNRRTDGIIALMIAANELQQCHSDVGGYIDKDNVVCTYTANSEEGYFTISDTALTVSSFTLVATPTSADGECSTLTINQFGLKDFTSTNAADSNLNPNGTLNRCWSR